MTMLSNYCVYSVVYSKLSSLDTFHCTVELAKYVQHQACVEGLMTWHSHTAWSKVRDRDIWQQVVNTAMLC